MQSGFITIGIFLVIQLVAAVWWASAMNTKMSFIVDSYQGTKSALDNHVVQDLATFSTKSEVANALVAHEKEVATALGFANKELAAMWKRIDGIVLKQGG